MLPIGFGKTDSLMKVCMHRLAIAEARLIAAKLVWHFDFELDGPHETWVDDARFYVVWDLKPLMVRFKSVR